MPLHTILGIALFRSREKLKETLGGAARIMKNKSAKPAGLPAAKIEPPSIEPRLIREPKLTKDLPLEMTFFSLSLFREERLGQDTAENHCEEKASRLCPLLNSSRTVEAIS